MQFLSLYLHIPFCRHRCSYCAFNIYVNQNNLMNAYVAALCQEIGWLAQNTPQKKVHTIYFGGGTPSLLPVASYQTLMTCLAQHFDLQANLEVTLEANPSGLDLAYLQGLRALGINRLCIGMQSANSNELALFERDHRLEDVHRAVELARQSGFDNLSLDLIYGVPHQTLFDWEHSLNAALSLQPQSFSLYALQLESGTSLTRRVKYDELPLPDDDLAADMYELATDKLGAVGYNQVEISTWSKTGYDSRHNRQYWHNAPYLGLGAGAHGYAADTRTVNMMRPEQYINCLAAQQTALPYPITAATQRHELVSTPQAMFETVMLNLRMLDEGLARQRFEKRFGVSLDAVYGLPIRSLKQRKLLYEVGNVLYLSKEARLLSNLVFKEFVPEAST